MLQRSFRNCPIAIVSAGCTLPDAIGLEPFWIRLMEGVPSIRPVSERRWLSEYHLCPDRSDREKTYTRFAASIGEDEYDRLRLKWYEPNTPLYRMRLQILESANQALAPWPKGFGKHKVDLFIGCMHLEDGGQNGNFDMETPEIRRVLGEMSELEAGTWREQYETYRKREIVPYLRGETSILPYSVRELQERFGFRGAGAFVDAACASSVAAVDVGVRRLMSGQADYVISGGVEAFLAPSAFVSFTSMGALAPEVCLPFDKRSEGLSLGEGCVLFVMRRLEDAIRDGNEIMGVIEGIGASSDGNAASLFSPTVNGQRRSYEECYRDLDLKRLNYLECHGTGTTLGDAVELQSCGEFFTEDLVIGSAKAIWGHTRGAAGAVGMLKALMVLRHKTIPPARYFREKGGRFAEHLSLNTEARTLSESAMVGVSSFGFGGINYHVALSSWSGEVPAKSQITPPPSSALIVGHEYVSYSELENISDWSEFKIPPRSSRQIDIAQRAALFVAKRVLENSRVPLKLIDKRKIAVISASPLGLGVLKRFATALQYREMKLIFPTMPDERRAELQRLRDRYAPITEDTSAGGLNNVIAGRVCNFFDFHGKSYHVDGEDLSWPMAVEAAMYELRDHAEMVILIGFDYHWDETSWVGNTVYTGAGATILMNEQTAERLAIKATSVVRFEDVCGTT